MSLTAEACEFEAELDAGLESVRDGGLSLLRVGGGPSVLDFLRDLITPGERGHQDPLASDVDLGLGDYLEGPDVLSPTVFLELFILSHVNSSRSNDGLVSASESIFPVDD